MLPLILTIGGYFLGSVLPAELFFKLYKNKSPLELGEKPSTFATLRHIGFWQALVCMIYDMGKGFLPVFLALKLGVNLYWLPVIAAAPVAGHNWPFLRWDKGGWGLAAASGALIGLGCWLTFVGVLGIPFIFLFPKRRGVAFGLVAFPLILAMFVVYHKPWEVFAAALFVMIVALIRRMTGEKKLIVANSNTNY